MPYIKIVKTYEVEVDEEKAKEVENSFYNGKTPTWKYYKHF